MRSLTYLIYLFGAQHSPRAAWRLVNRADIVDDRSISIHQIRRIFAYIRSKVSDYEVANTVPMGGWYSPFGSSPEELNRSVLLVGGYPVQSHLPPLTPVYAAPVEVDECELCMHVCVRAHSVDKTDA